MARLPRIPRTPGSVREHLRWQLDFLDASVERYDTGHEWEAARIAACLRILCHDTTGARPSVSLLTQAGLKDSWRFVETGVPAEPDKYGLSWHLLVVEMTQSGSRYKALADRHGNDPDLRVPFDTWWQGTAFETSSYKFTRSRIVLATANTDGGAHIDPSLEEDFEFLSRKSAMAGATHLPNRSVRHPIWELLRQMAFEMQLTAYEAAPENAPPPRPRPSGNYFAAYIHAVGGVATSAEPQTD